MTTPPPTTSPDNTRLLALICDEIRRGQRFLITSHARPDGDSIGSQVAMALAIRALGKDARGLVRRAARACFLVTEYLQGSKEQSLAYADHGRRFGELAVKEQPHRVEGHYFLALTSSKVAEAKNNLRLIKPAMAAAELAAKISPAYDDAGPLRFLGKVYLTAPAWPVSIGSPDRAVESLERAVKLAPAPLNRLFLGQAYFHEEEYAKARAALEQALREGQGKLHPRWRKEAEDYLQRLKAKTSS